MASRLSDAERDEIGVGRAAGESLRSIAARLGRHPSTIGREVARFEKWGPRYLPSLAVRISQQRHARRGRCRRPKLAADSALRRVVLDLLERRYSPQQIAGWLRSAHPDEPEMWVSHETIYQAIYVQSRGNLRAELSRQVALRSGRARRRAQPAAAGPVRSGRPWLGLHISERPAEAADRAVPGHWEGDLVEGGARAGSGGAIITLVERATRYVILIALPDGKLSEHVAAQLVEGMSWLPGQLRRTLTWDQGSEMAKHATFTLAADCPVYFCDPRSPWQRGSNENTNGLLREYFPKGKTNFRTITQADLDKVADELNDRPRQTLGWAKPKEKMAELLAGVATKP
jgi:transposase, IS30 family